MLITNQSINYLIIIYSLDLIIWFNLCILFIHIISIYLAYITSLFYNQSNYLFIPFIYLFMICRYLSKHSPIYVFIFICLHQSILSNHNFDIFFIYPYLSIFPYYIYLASYVSIQLFIYFSIFLYNFFLFIYLSIHISIDLSIYPSI